MASSTLHVRTNWHFASLGRVSAAIGFIIASAAFLAAVFGFLSDSSSVFDRFWPTPSPFNAAANRDTLIVIATFYETTATKSEPHTKILRRLNEEIAKLQDNRIIAVIDPNTILKADQRTEAEALGKQYNASMVIWGEDTGVQTIVNFLNMRDPSLPAADLNLNELLKTQLANPSEYVQFVTDSLPDEIAFLALFAIGNSYYSDQKYSKAIDTLKAAIESAGTPINIFEAGGLMARGGEPSIGLMRGLIAANLQLASIYMTMQPSDYNSAISYFTSSINIFPFTGNTYIDRASAYLQIDEWDKALADLDMAASLEPVDSQLNILSLHKTRAVVYLVKGDLDKAKAEVDQLMELQPNDAFVYLLRAFYYVDKGEASGAAADVEYAAKLAPDDRAVAAMSDNIRALLQMSGSTVENSIQAYDKAIQQNPSMASSYTGRGNAYLMKGDYERAIADFSQAIALAPERVSGYQGRAEAYSELGDIDNAITDYTQVISLAPEDVTAYIYRGLLYIKHKGDVESALADFNKAIALAPEDGAGYMLRGVLYNENGDYENALMDLSQAFALGVEDATLYVVRGDIYRAQGEPDLALADYSKAIELDQEQSAAYYNRGLINIDKGNWETVISDYTSAIELNPMDPGSFVNRSIAYYKKDDWDLAIADCSRAIELDPTIANAYYYLGLANSGKGEKQQAIKALQQAAALYQQQGNTSTYQETLVLLENLQ